MRANLTPDMELAERLLTGLHDATFDGVGVTREAYGPGEQIGHDMARAAAEAMGLECRVDAAGNMLMTLPGRDRAAPRIVLGSHLDSVPQGGDYDGAAGVFAGLAVLSGLQRGGFRPARYVTVLAIRAEEGGAWFPAGLPGSRAALGRLPAEALQSRRQDSGRTMEDHMREAGFDPDAVARGETLLPPASIAAYLELHIEQGPVLEAEGIPLGIVTGLPGVRRMREGRVSGEYNHSGATPRKYRADAGMALAELAYRLDDYWARLDAMGRRLVVTFCVMGTTEGAGFTKVPGEARFQLDVRSVEPENLERVTAELDRLVAQIEARRGVQFDLGPRLGGNGAPMAQAVRDGLARAADAVGVAWRAMPSGGGHDAASFANAGVPSGMLFVRNQNGSHNPDEAMRMDDLAAGCSVMLRWVEDVAV